MKIFGSLLGAIALICMVSVGKAETDAELARSLIEANGLSDAIGASVQTKVLKYLWAEYDMIAYRVSKPINKIKENLDEYFNGDDVYFDDEYASTDPDEIVDTCKIFATQLNPVKRILKLSGNTFVEMAKSQEARKIYQVYEFCKALTKHRKPDSMADLYPDV